jgi:hypothetical protein
MKMLNKFHTHQQLPDGGVKAYFGGYGGLALSQSAPDAPFGNRTLYVVAGGEVDAYNFTGTGLPSPVTLATYTNFDMALTEVDLSHDGATLAWGNYNNAEIHTLGISPASLTIQTYNMEVGGNFGIPGLEYSGDNQFIYFNTTNPAGDLYRLNVANGAIQPLNAPFKVGNTQLERAKDGFTYFVTSSQQELGVINSGGAASISPLALTNNSGSGFVAFFNPLYTLPDQIDGQDYSQLSGIEQVELNEILIGGTILPNTFATSGLPQYGLCGPIDLELDATGTPMDYQIDIVSINSLNGTPFSTIASVTLPMSTTFPLDLNCLLSSACTLFDATVNGGTPTFRIDVTLVTRCETVTKSGFFEVFNLPNNVNGVLGMNAGNGNPTCMSSQNINSPCLGTVNGANIDLQSSTGAITFYQLKIDEVSCATGAVINNLYDGPQENVTNPGTIVLNTLEINGVQGFFSQNNQGADWLFRCLRIEATVGNNCGSTTDFTYFQFNSLFFQDPDGSEFNFSVNNESLNQNAAKIELENSEDLVSLEVATYPNPFKNQLIFSITTEKEADYSLRILNSSGQTINQEFTYSTLYRGTNSIDIEMGELTPGLYFYQLQVGDKIKTGKILKVQ